MMDMALPMERQERIVALLEEREALLTQKIADQLGISLATVRRDLIELAQRGLVIRTHGGAMRPSRSLAQEPAFASKTARMREEKIRIAAHVADMVEDGSTLIVDAGTTTLEVARRLAGRRIVVIALDLPAAQELSQGQTEVLLCGGRVRSNSYSITGPWAEEHLRDLRADLFIMGAHAVDERGVSNAGLEEAMVKMLALKASTKTILVADHTKFGQRAMVQVCPTSEIDLVVTDKGSDQAWLLENFKKVIRV
jgi:DeoR/GlpR family transcriptional regulator of sugar metabolism